MGNIAEMKELAQKIAATRNKVDALIIDFSKQKHTSRIYKNDYLESRRRLAINSLGVKWIGHKDHVQTVNQQLSARQAKALLVANITENNYAGQRTIKFSFFDQLWNRFLG